MGQFFMNVCNFSKSVRSWTPWIVWTHADWCCNRSTQIKEFYYCLFEQSFTPNSYTYPGFTL